MGNCPSCGAELGFGIAICPNCGGQIAGDSLTDDGHHGDLGGDGSGDTIDGGPGSDSLPGGSQEAPGPQVEGPEQIEDRWIGEDALPNEPIEVDHGVPGSEIPPERGGGFQQRPPDDDSPGPYNIISADTMDPHHDEIPERPGSHLDLDDSTRGFKPGFNAGLALAVLILIIIAALSGWYILGGDDGDDDGDGNGNGEGNGEPNGNGDDPTKAVHINKEQTSGTYPFEPPGEYHITVAIRNNASKSQDLTGYVLSVTVWIEWKVKGFEDMNLTGSIASGETRTFDLVVGTEVLGGGDEITVGLSLRKDDGDTFVQAWNYEQTI